MVKISGLLAWLWHQIICMPVTLTKDLPRKMANLWEQFFVHEETPNMQLPPKGSMRMLVFFLGWNQTARNLLHAAQAIAVGLKAGLCFMPLPPKCGNIQPCQTAQQALEEKLDYLMVAGFEIWLFGYSRGGLNALYAADYLRQCNYTNFRVVCVASPLRGSCLGTPQLWMLKVFSFLGRRIPFFAAIEAAEEMIPDSNTTRHCAAIFRALRKAGIKVLLFRFRLDGLIMDDQSSPYGEPPAILVPGSRGHTSICDEAPRQELIGLIKRSWIRTLRDAA